MMRIEGAGKLRVRDAQCKNVMIEIRWDIRSCRHDCLPPFSHAEHIMGLPVRATDRPWTKEEFYAARDAAPAGERWELVDGEVLVTPAPHWMHQRIIARLFVLIDAYVRANRLGEAFVSPLDVKLKPGLVLQP